MEWIIAAMLVVVGVIHILPVPGVLGAGRLAALYGVQVEEPNLVILMRHRAVLFGLLGVFFVYAAFERSMQNLALGAGYVSVASFLGLAHSTGKYNGKLSRVVVADWVALVCLIVGTGTKLVGSFAR